MARRIGILCFMVQAGARFELKTLLSSLGLGTLIRQIFGIRLGRLHQYAPRGLSVKQLGQTNHGSDLPAIALVTPSFNQARFVGQTIHSVIGQDFPRVQYVVQDACSKDGTEDVLKSFVHMGFDIHIEADNGQTDALNKGFSRTSAEIMGYLNSDDLLLPGTLLFVAKYFRDNPSVDVIYGNRLIIDESGLEIGRWILPGHDANVLRFIDYVPQESMFWRRRVWDRVGAKFDSTLQFAMDWDLILRFLDSGAVIRHVSELFGIFRVHSDQKSQLNYVSRGSTEMAALRLRHGGKELGFFQRNWLHGKYLYRHVKVDAAWKRTLGPEND